MERLSFLFLLVVCWNTGVVIGAGLADMAEEVEAMYVEDSTQKPRSLSCNDWVEFFFFLLRTLLRYLSQIREKFICR